MGRKRVKIFNRPRSTVHLPDKLFSLCLRIPAWIFRVSPNKAKISLRASLFFAITCASSPSATTAAKCVWRGRKKNRKRFVLSIFYFLCSEKKKDLKSSFRTWYEKIDKKNKNRNIVSTSSIYVGTKYFDLTFLETLWKVLPRKNNRASFDYLLANFSKMIPTLTDMAKFTA